MAGKVEQLRLERRCRRRKSKFNAARAARKVFLLLAALRKVFPGRLRVERRINCINSRKVPPIIHSESFSPLSAHLVEKKLFTLRAFPARASIKRTAYVGIGCGRPHHAV